MAAAVRFDPPLPPLDGKLCGDAAHIWVPFAGYGMNAGIADAMNLSWKLAGVLNGWAESAILEAYVSQSPTRFRDTP
ncbi:MAG: FAD-dependent monooxygenase [Candidatus Acidiferrum sp.]